MLRFSLLLGLYVLLRGVGVPELLESQNRVLRDIDAVLVREVHRIRRAEPLEVVRSLFMRQHGFTAERMYESNRRGRQDQGCVKSEECELEAVGSGSCVWVEGVWVGVCV